MADLNERKGVLDPCCGGRMMWFDKKNPNVVFGDQRSEKLVVTDRDPMAMLQARAHYGSSQTYCWIFVRCHIQMDHSSWSHSTHHISCTPGLDLGWQRNTESSARIGATTFALVSRSVFVCSKAMASWCSNGTKPRSKPEKSLSLRRFLRFSDIHPANSQKRIGLCL